MVDRLGLKDFILLGHSTGGAIAVRYMARHCGEGVKKLILCVAAAPSLIKRSNFPYGLKKEAVEVIIKGTYSDRPKMLKNFGETFFYRKPSKPFMDWFLELGFKAAGWATAEVANTWLKEELFDDLETIEVPILITHGVHDKICLPPLGEEQHRFIKNSKLVKFENSGHGVFYDEREKFNSVVQCFIEE